MREAVANVLAEIEEIHPEVVDVEDAAELAVDDGLTQQGITEEAIGVDTELQEVRRMEDTALALEDMSVVEDHIAEASPTDLLLIETATRLAAAGSDVEVEEVIPGLESYAGKKPSMEGIRQLVSTIWQAIKNFCAKIWLRVTQFFNLIITSLFGVKRAVEKQKEKLAALKASGAKIKQGHEKLTLGQEGRNLAADEGGIPKDGIALLQGCANFSNALEWLTGEYTKSVGKAYQDMGASLAGTKEGDDLAVVFERVLRTAEKANIRAFPSKFGRRAPKHPSYSTSDYSESKPFPGGYVLLERKHAVRISSSDITKKPEVVADELTRGTIAFKKIPMTVPVNSESREFKTMDIAQLEKLNTVLDAIITHVKVYAESGKNTIATAKSNYEKAADKFAMTFTVENDKGDRYIKRSLKFTIMLTEAATQPITAAVAAANTLVRNYIILTRRNMAAYA